MKSYPLGPAVYTVSFTTSVPASLAPNLPPTSPLVLPCAKWQLAPRSLFAYLRSDSIQTVALLISYLCAIIMTIKKNLTLDSLGILKCCSRIYQLLYVNVYKICSDLIFFLNDASVYNVQPYVVFSIFQIYVDIIHRTGRQIFFST